MTIHHIYKYIYVHIPRTSGTSFEEHNNVIGIWPFPIYKHLWGVGALRGFNGDLVMQHMTYNQIEKYCNIENINIGEYLSFSIVRNPIDRVISLCHYWKHIISDFTLLLEEFEKIINDKNYKSKIPRYHIISQYEYLINKCDQIGVNYTLHYEDFQISQEMKNKNIDLSYHIFDNNKHIKNMSEINREQINLIQKIYKKDFDFFNYDYN
jgi:hypothetical protein